MEQAICEDMAALTIGTQLRFIECDEGQVGAGRHRFGRAKQPAGMLRLDPLFAGDQRNAVCTLDCADPVVDLARQQAQRKADRAR